MKKIVVLLILVLLVSIIGGCKVKKAEEVTDAEKFATEYSVSKKNPFKYSNIDEILEIFEKGNGIVFFADSDCEWCNATAKVLTEALNYKNVSQVYYYNPKKIRDKNSKKYKKLINVLKDYLEVDSENNPYLYLPDLYIVNDGKIIGHNNDTATMNGSVDEAFKKETKKELKEKYIELISKYNVRECSGGC